MGGFVVAGGGLGCPLEVMMRLQVLTLGFHQCSSLCSTKSSVRVPPKSVAFKGGPKERLGGSCRLSDPRNSGVTIGRSVALRRLSIY